MTSNTSTVKRKRTSLLPEPRIIVIPFLGEKARDELRPTKSLTKHAESFTNTPRDQLGLDPPVK
jgi:hypothetical protein